jgi:type I restriction enzyme M protein
MLSFLFLRYLSGNYEESAKKELGADYPQLSNFKISIIKFLLSLPMTSLS